jgi:hypothetical protein
VLSAPSVANVPSAQMSGWTDDNLRGRTAASVVRHHLRRRPHYADLFDDDLDVVADRLDVAARTAREFLADYLLVRRRQPRT